MTTLECAHFGCGVGGHRRGCSSFWEPAPTAEPPYPAGFGRNVLDSPEGSSEDFEPEPPAPSPLPVAGDPPEVIAAFPSEYRPPTDPADMDTTAPSPDLDPLEEQLQEEALFITHPPDARWIAALRVLKRGHGTFKLQCPDVSRCTCGEGVWPCPILAEAAAALRGERK